MRQIIIRGVLQGLFDRVLAVYRVESVLWLTHAAHRTPNGLYFEAKSAKSGWAIICLIYFSVILINEIIQLKQVLNQYIKLIIPVI